MTIPYITYEFQRNDNKENLVAPSKREHAAKQAMHSSQSLTPFPIGILPNFWPIAQMIGSDSLIKFNDSELTLFDNGGMRYTLETQNLIPLNLDLIFGHILYIYKYMDRLSSHSGAGGEFKLSVVLGNFKSALVSTSFIDPTNLVINTRYQEPPNQVYNGSLIRHPAPLINSSFDQDITLSAQAILNEIAYQCVGEKMNMMTQNTAPAKINLNWSSSSVASILTRII